MVYKKQTTFGLEGRNLCPGAMGWNPKKRKFLMTFLLSLWCLSKQATTWETPSSSSAYSSRETNARLLPSASWPEVTLTYNLSCQRTASQVVRTPPSPAAENEILTASSSSAGSGTWGRMSPALLMPEEPMESSPLLTRSEGYPLNPAQVPSGNSQLARATSNPL